MEDAYKTITSDAEGFFKDKGSKFFAHAYPIESDEEIKPILESLRKKYHDARHHCYAYVLLPDQSVFRANDDGEPSGTAGKPIHGAILSSGLTNIFIVVVRYFGGTKLGVRGLIDAYKAAAFDAIHNCEIVEKTVNDIYEIVYDYPLMNNVMRIMKDEDLNQIATQFEERCRIEISVRQKDSKRIFEKFEEIHQIQINLLRTE
ncbi:MAG: YigZ family protein [Bacteroidales bacterium]|nr:YigZ family protein [Bacteroidales bacterium]